MRTISTGILGVVAASLLLPAADARAQDLYDVAIVGGRVIDPESGLDAVRNVGVRGDVIATVTEQDLDASYVIDARGLVVAPGLIDILASPSTADEAGIFKIFDGVTSVVSMHGGSVDPGPWYGERVSAGLNHHFGTTVGHGALRVAAGATDRYAAATPEQVEVMVETARAALDAGGWA